MRTLITIDYVIIGVYILLVFIAGMALTKKASDSVDSFFLGGRSMPWWLVGISMAATNFSIDTPLAVSKFVQKEGISGVWFMWASAISALFVTFFFSRLWRRTGVLTDAEVIEQRYSGKAAEYLRLFKGLYFGVIFNAFIIGWVFLSLNKVLTAVTDLNVEMAMVVSVSVVFIYSISSGFYGVVMTDLFQYFIALIGSVILAYLSVAKVGGLDQLTTSLSSMGKEKADLLNFFPDFDNSTLMPFSVFLVYILVQWWAHKYADGGGKHIQRMLSAKDEEHAFKGSALYTSLTYCFQIWPWIITSLCAIILLGESGDPEMAYPRMMGEVLPHGLFGLVVVCLIGAFMSTIDTHLNLGASYIVNDIYKRFMVKNQTPKHYVFASRIIMLLLMIVSYAISKNIDSVASTWKFLLTFASGAGLTWIIRWFWWRANAWTEFSGMIASGLCATVLKIYANDMIYTDKLLITVAFSTVVWVTVTFLTSATDDQVLKDFVLKVRPGSAGWNKITEKFNLPKGEFMKKSLMMWLLSLCAFFGLNFGIGALLLKGKPLAFTLLGLSLCSLITIIYIHKTEKV